LIVEFAILQGRLDKVKAVAVERGLEPVKQYLEQQGCQVLDVDNDGSAVAQQAACMCITGADKNIMGMEDIIADIPIVSCDGLSPEQVYQRVKNYLQ
jgi:hypothetical protein